MTVSPPQDWAESQTMMDEVRRLAADPALDSAPLASFTTMTALASAVMEFALEDWRRQIRESDTHASMIEPFTTQRGQEIYPATIGEFASWGMQKAVASDPGFVEGVRTEWAGVDVRDLLSAFHRRWQAYDPEK